MRAGRKRLYGPEVVRVVREIWEKMGQRCSRVLKAALPEWLPYWEARNGKLSAGVRKRVLQISRAQIDRVLKPSRTATDLWRRRMPKPGSLLRRQIPIRTGPWQIQKPGYFEADSVAHCGSSMAGSFVWSLTFTDILTQWTCLRSVWNCGQYGVVESLRDVEARLPFALLGVDSDNGHEFLQHHLWKYLKEREEPVEFTRSRPYHKNDNAHVEQKNWTHVRELLGYERLEHPELVVPINELFRTVWEPLNNLFCPCMKLSGKRRVGRHYRKRYDTAQTPCDRLLASGLLTRSQRRELVRYKAQFDPYALAEQLEQKLRALWSTIRRLNKAA